MKRELVEEVVEEQGVSISRVCRLLVISRSTFRYVSIKDDSCMIEHLQNKALLHPQEGFWKAYGRIRNEGVLVNHKRLHRIYKHIGLPLRRKVKKRLPARVKQPLEVPLKINNTWSIDFMSDALENGRRIRSFNVMDDFNREALFIEINHSIKSNRVIWVLNHLINKRGKPETIRMDNGPEFIAEILSDWSQMHGIKLLHIQPGKPMQNGYIERFNRTYRESVLDRFVFKTLEEIREITEEWMYDYNHFRPHDALNGLAPLMLKCG